jgi:fucose permease
MEEYRKRNLIFLIIFFISLVTNTIPPILTTVQSTFKISPAISSILPSSSTFGSLLINFIGGFFIASFGVRSSFKLSLVFLIFGSLLFYSFLNFIIVSFATFLLGMSMGGIFMSMTSIFAHLNSKIQNYGFFHACFGFGGILAPVLVYFFLKFNMNLRYLYLFYSIAGILFLLFLSNKFSNIKYEKTNFKRFDYLLKRKGIFISLLLFFIYSGTEVAFITWQGNLFTNGFGYSKELSSIFLSAFWIFYTLVRIFTDKISHFLGSMRVLIISSSLASVSVLFMLLFKLNYFFIITGILIAPFFPTLQKLMNSKVEHRDIGLYTGLVYAADSVGILLLIPFMGFIMDFNPFLAYTVPLVTLLIILSLVFSMRKQNLKS